MIERVRARGIHELAVCARKCMTIVESVYGARKINQIYRERKYIYKTNTQREDNGAREQWERNWLGREGGKRKGGRRRTYERERV